MTGMDAAVVFPQNWMELSHEKSKTEQTVRDVLCKKKCVKIYSILFDRCMKAVGFQCNVARCAVGVMCEGFFMFLIMFFTDKNLAIRCCVNDCDSIEVKV